jgi:hypothetical protein
MPITRRVAMLYGVFAVLAVAAPQHADAAVPPPHAAPVPSFVGPSTGPIIVAVG